VLAVLAVLLALGLPAWSGPADGPRVAAIGDSLLRQLQFDGPTHPGSDRAFTRSLVDQGWRGAVRAENAYRTAQLRPLAREAAQRAADALIVSSGAADVRWVSRQPDPTAARAAVRRQIRLLLDDAGDRCVVWPTFTPAGDAGRRRTATTINQALRAQAELRPTLEVPEWARLAADHPGWFLADGVHLSGRGEAAFQSTLLNATRHCL
jgi:hypothetical protein